MGSLLKVEGLTISVAGSVILHDVDLNINEGEIHVIFGPNGSGKSTLMMAIMGFMNYKITKGRILFKDRDVTGLPMDERVRMGMGMMLQRPPNIDGLTTRHLLEVIRTCDTDLDELAERMDLTRFMDRDVNVGFSGGEIKRSEMMQLLVQQPDLVMLDEPESGVDLDNLELIGSSIKTALGKYAPCNHRSPRERKKSGIIVTHTGDILKHLPLDVGHVICEGTIVCRGHPMEILENIKQRGYKECVQCHL